MQLLLQKKKYEKSISYFTLQVIAKASTVEFLLGDCFDAHQQFKGLCSHSEEIESMNPLTTFTPLLITTDSLLPLPLNEIFIR